jgi:type IV secretory pathway TraG/TraD family ATPase VirD4
MAAVTYGSARFSTYKEVKRAGMLRPEGIVLGTRSVGSTSGMPGSRMC